MDERQLQQSLASIAKSVISDENDCDIVRHVREIIGVLADMGRYRDPYFEVFRYFESETEDIPIGDLRKKVDEQYLQRLDAKLARVMFRCRADLLTKCSEIVNLYSVQDV